MEIESSQLKSGLKEISSIFFFTVYYQQSNVSILYYCIRDHQLLQINLKNNFNK